MNTKKNNLENFLLNIPNIPNENVPDGEDEKNNIEIFSWLFEIYNLVQFTWKTKYLTRLESSEPIHLIN